jgi:MATE family multidrug resistance protein
MSVIAGWIGGLAVAAWAIVLNVAAIVFMVPLGFSTGAAVRVGQAYGARDPAGITRSGLVAFVAMSVFGIAISLVVWPNSAFVARAYTDSAPTLAMAIPALAFSCLLYWPDSLQVVVAATLRARGDVWVPTYTHLASYIGIMMPLAWWLAIPRGMGILGMVAAIVIASVVSAGLLLIRFRVLAKRDR